MAAANTSPSYERELAANRARKRRYTGTCGNCGGVTRYSGRRGQRVSSICAKCRDLVYDFGASTRLKGPMQTRLVGFLSEPRRFTAIRDHLGISSAHAGVTLNRAVKSGLILRVSRGLYRLP